MAYSTTNDLLLGGIPIPAGLQAQKFVNDAADEVDSQIGMLYITPVDVNSSTLVRPVKLLLKRLNNFIATGRLILAVTSNNEDDRLHAYGLSLLKEANEALHMIASGQVVLDGAPVTDANVPRVSVPLIGNLDSESNVEAFYDRIANPTYLWPGSVFL